MVECCTVSLSVTGLERLQAAMPCSSSKRSCSSNDLWCGTCFSGGLEFALTVVHIWWFGIAQHIFVRGRWSFVGHNDMLRGTVYLLLSVAMAICIGNDETSSGAVCGCCQRRRRASHAADGTSWYVAHLCAEQRAWWPSFELMISC